MGLLGLGDGIVDWDPLHVLAAPPRRDPRDDLRAVVEHEPGVEPSLGARDALDQDFGIPIDKLHQG